MNATPPPLLPDAALARALGDSSAAAPHALAHRCRNCGAEAPGAYCPACGQETRLAMPTVRELMRDAAGRLVAVDGRLWCTLGLLMFRPGLLTVEYLRGRRKRYVRPARLFFFTSLFLFAAIRFESGPVQIITIDASEERTVAPSANAQLGSAATGAAGDTAPNLKTVRVDPDLESFLASTRRFIPESWRKRIEHFQTLSTEDQTDQIYSGLLRYAPYGMVVLLPAFAFLQYVSYLPGRRRHPLRPRRYAEHLVYGAHLHAFAFLVLVALIAAPVAALRWGLVAWVLVYVTRARQRVYGGSWLGGVLRSFGVAIVYLMLLVLVMSALLTLAVAIR